VIDKPPDMTSAALVAFVKRLLNAGKVGHAGTLDPFATGVMICCINKGTRLADFFLKDRKTYEAVLCLGEATDTQDKTGKAVLRRVVPDFSMETLENAFKAFRGSIDQLPPVYSALKHNGVPLYKLARAGKPVRKPARKVFISKLEILDVCLPEIRFEVTCSAGTYVRTLGADIGEVLGCGGHLKALRRIESSGFSIDEAVSLSEIKALALSGDLGKRMISMRDALKNLPEHLVSDEQVESIKNGVLITQAELTGENGQEGLVKAVDGKGRLVAIFRKVRGLPHYQYCCVLV